MTETHGTGAAVRRALAAVDLNLLPVLDVLLETHSVTESGRRLGLSQPAVSRALARLRAALDDELLVRTGRVMVPTPRALALQQPLRDTLHQVHSLVRPVAPFDPAQHERRWRVVVPDYGDIVVLPELLAALSDLAPRASVEVRNDYSQEGLEWADIVLAPQTPLITEGPASIFKRSFRSQRLFVDRFVMVAHASHPVLSAPLTLDAWLSVPHIRVDPSLSGEGAVDKALRSLGRERHVALEIPNFSGVAATAARTRLVGVMPERQARRIAAADVAICDPPIAIPSLILMQYWQSRVDGDPAHRWLRELLVRLGSRL